MNTYHSKDMKRDNRLKNISDKLTFAFQPIVHIQSGDTVGFEALLRGVEEQGFQSIQELFDTAYSQLVLYQLDLALRNRAFYAFSSFISNPSQRLFYNLDNRLLHMPDYSPGNTDELLKKHGLNTANLCFEISERHNFGCVDTADSILTFYKQHGYCIALDDYGSGYAGLQMLYHAEPNYIKIDRFFIKDIDRDPRKRFFVSSIVSMAHVLGARVIAEGIETSGELLACREIGCDWAQGFFIQKPQTDYSKLRSQYEHVAKRMKTDRRVYSGGNTDKVRAAVEVVEPVLQGTSMSRVLNRFKADSELEHLPVVNNLNEPVGIIAAKQLRSYVYSPYGISLIQNQEKKNDLTIFMDPAPVIELGTPLERILQIQSLNMQKGILIFTHNAEYAGILNPKGLLKLISDKKMADALDSNPLTRLPGNKRINEWLADHIPNTDEHRGLVYFDFDNFKPFNDTYGFRVGDRAIMLFAEILKKKAQKNNCFAAHVGGDDFFLGVSGDSGFYDLVQEIQERFHNDIQSIYTEEDRQRGFILAKGRDSRVRKFPLLTVSAAIISIPSGVQVSSIEYSAYALAVLKEKAKKAKDKRACIEWAEDFVSQR